MSDLIPPTVPSDEDGFDLLLAIHEAALAILGSRHRLPAAMIGDLLESDPVMQAEYDAIIDRMTIKPDPQPDNWLANGIQVFEVTGDPDGDLLQGGNRYRVVRQYRFNYVPNRPAPRRRSVADWAWNFAQPRNRQS